MAKIANVALTNTFNTWRTRSNEAFDRLSQFAINNSSLYANTLTANVSFTSKGLATFQGRATVGTNLTVSGNTSTNKLTVTSLLTSSGNTTLGDSAADITTINGSGTVSRNWSVTGNTSSNKLSITSSATGSAANLTFNKITATSSLTSSGNTFLGAAGKTTTITGISSVSGRATVSTNLDVSGNTSTDKLTVASLLSSTGNTTLGNAATDFLTVSGNTVFNHSVIVTRNFRVTGNTFVDGVAKFNGSTTLGDAASDATTFNGLATFTHSAAITRNLTVSGNTALTGVLANNSLGTAGQVLKTNGTAVYWDAAGGAGGGGGGGDFNTAVSNNNGYLITDALLNAFIAAATAGKRYIIRSIHVTNIGDTEATVTGQFDGTTYANTSFATNVPVPVGSSVELFKRPKVLQPSDKIKLRASPSGYLHATIAHEVVTGTSHYGVGADITTSNTYTTLHTATGDGVIESILLTNDDGISDSQARVIWTDSANTIQGYYAYNLVVPAQSTVELLEAPKFLKNGFKVRVYSTSPNRLEAIIAGKNA